MKSQRGKVVVGYDGSGNARAAVRWAATEARHRGLPLTVIHIIDSPAVMPAWMPGSIGPFPWMDIRSGPAGQLAEEGATLARQATSHVDVSSMTYVAPVTQALLAAGRDAELLVIGTRGHGELTGAILGSVAFAVAAHAHCPVTVVRGRIDRPGPQRPVVVGVDGSPCATDALRAASDLAMSYGAGLNIVSVYPSPPRDAWAVAAYLELSAYGNVDLESAPRHVACVAADEALRLARSAYPGLAVTTQIREGRPGRVLAESAAGAGALVVGTRGRGGFAGMLLGSVSHSLIHSAPCPVTIVHDQQSGDTPTRRRVQPHSADDVASARGGERQQSQIDAVGHS